MLRFAAIQELVKTLLLQLKVIPVIQKFALGGGTSLALRFGHRLSVDLDFSTVHEFASETLAETLQIGPFTIIGKTVNSLTLDVAGVKLDLLHHACRILEPVERISEVPMISLPDLVAMKLNALANRGSKKDFYDIMELLDHFALQQLIGYFTEKCPTTDPFTVIRSLAWLEDAETEPDSISLKGMTWAAVKTRVSRAVAGFKMLAG